MEDSGAILCQISSLKDMLDQVNEEIEANIQVTREIESEIVRCEEVEADMAVRESDLTKTFYLSQFDIVGLFSVTRDSSNYVKVLEEELCSLNKKRQEMIQIMNDKREEFARMCLEFQREIDRGGNDEVVKLLSEKESFENEICLLDQKNNALENSILAFVEELLQDLHDSNSALQVEIQNDSNENEKLLKDITDLKTMLLSDFN